MPWFSKSCLVLLAAIVGWASITLAIFRTPEGTHCPTAPVQAVLVSVKDKCGCVKIVERKPRPGEASFLQCQCAEKKAGRQVAILSFRYETGIVKLFDFPLPGILPEIAADYLYQETQAFGQRSPLVQPPPAA